MVTTNITKVAWIRNEDAPIGTTARGHFNCPCGNRIEAGLYDQRDYSVYDCQNCGRCFSSIGWIMNAHTFESRQD